MTALSRDLALPILKNCFPKGENVRIVQDQVLEGERHLTSDVTRFIIEYEENRSTRRKNVVMKVPASSAVASLCESLSIYDQEICMYETVIPKIKKYLRKSLAPALLYKTDSKILVLEDLSVRGYISGEKLPLLNFDEAKGAMKTFARFHSTTHKLYEEVPHIFENFLESPFDKIDFMQIVSPWRAVVLELLRRKEEYHLVSKIEAVFSYLEEHRKKISAIVDKSKFKFVALNHGDGRKDNFLFKHTPNEEVKVQFVDYQGCFISSPAYDLSIFLQSSVSASVLEAHSDDLVDEYLRELNALLKELNCASTYERADLDEDFKSLKFIFFLGFFVLLVTVSPVDRKELEGFIDLSTDTTNLCDSCLNDEQFVLAVYGWLKYFEKSKMFNEF